MERGQMCQRHRDHVGVTTFHVVKKWKTWTAAQQHCRDNFTDLATIDDMTEIEKLKRVIQDVGAEGRVWIGLRQGRWKWSLADGENEAEFWNWDTDRGQPTPRAGLDCGCISNAGKWHDCYCSVLRQSICYNGPNSTPPYVLVEEKKNWADAQRYCRDKYTDLASVRNQAANDKIYTDILSGLAYNPFPWIGLFREWEWSDGSSSSFRNWASGQPSYYSSSHSPCVVMRSSGLWNDESCDSRRYFVCYEALPVVEVVSPQPPLYSGDEVTLRCDIPRYAGQHQYVWLKDNNTVPGETSQTITITLPGQYQCHRQRGGSSVAPYISKPLDIKYQALPNATVEVVSPQSPFYSGDEVTLKCNITQYTDWRYGWFKDGSQIPHKTGQIVTITLPLEAGQYQCDGLRKARPHQSYVSKSTTIANQGHVKRTQMVRVEMEASDDMDMEDPDVQKAFLQQIGDRLKAKGFRGDVKLSWMKQPDGKVFHKKKNDKKKEKRDEF
ncbi:C-type mannose receptor 2-like [Engraulis encrasicolus]|uniref:C-type mannose receptor 2-like n=1 Tax=Engraulis encrasicolus TaxID=184585 RepID=UPI002FD73B18